MAENQWQAINDSIKGIAGCMGIEVAQRAETLSTTNISQIGAEVAQFVISALTIYSLIRSIFFTKKNQSDGVQ